MFDLPDARFDDWRIEIGDLLKLKPCVVKELMWWPGLGFGDGDFDYVFLSGLERRKSFA